MPVSKFPLVAGDDVCFSLRSNLRILLARSLQITQHFHIRREQHHVLFTASIRHAQQIIHTAYGLCHNARCKAHKYLAGILHHIKRQASIQHHRSVVKDSIVYYLPRHTFRLHNDVLLHSIRFLRSLSSDLDDMSAYLRWPDGETHRTYTIWSYCDLLLVISNKQEPILSFQSNKDLLLLIQIVIHLHLYRELLASNHSIRQVRVYEEILENLKLGFRNAYPLRSRGHRM